MYHGTDCCACWVKVPDCAGDETEDRDGGKIDCGELEAIIVAALLPERSATYTDATAETTINGKKNLSNFI